MSESTTVIRVQDVSKRFIIRKEKSVKERLVNFGRSNHHKQDFWALRDVNIDVESGTTIGLIGANGSGKSTLLKAIGGIIQPTSGTVQRRGRLAALLELGAGFHPDLTGRENVYLNASILGLTRKQTDKHFEAIVDFSGIEPFIDTQVKFYSSGMYVRLAFAVAVHVDPEILLVDEVLAVGDEPFQRKCMDRIRSFQAEGRTIVLVSHSLSTVGEICDRGVVLRAGQVQFDGDTAEALRVLREGFEQDREKEEEARAAKAVRAAEAARAIREAQKAQETEAQKAAEAAAEEAARLDAENPKHFARVDSVRLINPATNDDAGLIHAGDPLRLEVSVSADSPLDEWVVGMGIETPLGQSVFGTNSDRLGFVNEPFTGTRRFTFDLPQLHLGAGRYFVHASLGTMAMGSFTRIEQAAAFDVEDGTNNVGLLSVKATLQETEPALQEPEPASSAS